MSRDFQIFQQLVLRVPDELIDRVSSIVNGTTGTTKHIEVHPQDESDQSDDFLFCIDEDIFPALLVMLPCNIETYKTLDHSTYFKSGDIGQMLVVYHDAESRDEARRNLRKLDGISYFPSGITPPTTDIVKRKYEKLFHYGPYPNYQMTDVGKNIINYKVNESIEEIYEEVVPFEPWMADAQNPGGITITLTGIDWTNDSLLLQQHPEIFQKKIDQQLDQEEEEAKRLLTTKVPAISTATSFEQAAQALAIQKGFHSKKPVAKERKERTDNDTTNTTTGGGGDGEEVLMEGSTVMVMSTETETLTGGHTTDHYHSEISQEKSLKDGTGTGTEVVDDGQSEGEGEGGEMSEDSDGESWLDGIEEDNTEQ
eukprot:gene5629-11361_t